MVTRKPFEDPNEPPWGPVGQIQAYGKIAQAFKHGSGRQRRAAAIFLGVLVFPLAVVLIVLLVSALV